MMLENFRLLNAGYYTVFWGRILNMPRSYILSYTWVEYKRFYIFWELTRVILHCMFLCENVGLTLSPKFYIVYIETTSLDCCLVQQCLSTAVRYGSFVIGIREDNTNNVIIHMHICTLVFRSQCAS